MLCKCHISLVLGVRSEVNWWKESVFVGEDEEEEEEDGEYKKNAVNTEQQC